MPFVADASITMTWCFRGEATPHTEALLARFQQEGIEVPALWPAEVTNGLLMGMRRGRISAIEVEQFLNLLEDAPVTIAIDDPFATHRRILELAQAHGLTAYDATYLELALRLRLPLATLDAELRAAAQRANVALL